MTRNSSNDGGSPKLSIPATADASQPRWNRCAAPNATPVTIDLRLTRRAGEAVPFAVTFTNLLDDPSLAGIVVTGHDIADRVVAEQELRQSNSLLATTLDATTEGILVVDESGHITTFNRGFAEMWHISDDILDARDDERALACSLEQLVDPDAFLAKVREVYADPEAHSHDIAHFTTGRVFERHSRPRRLDGRVVGRVWSFRDITEHEQLKQQLAHQALHDALTGLPNKRLFRDRIDHALRAVASKPTGAGRLVRRSRRLQERQRHPWSLGGRRAPGPAGGSAHAPAPAGGLCGPARRR